MLTLTPENTGRYLIERGIVADRIRIDVEALGGGISNVVLKVCSPDDPALCMVIKQPLAELKVEDSWEFDVSRVFIERDCMRMLSDLLPRGWTPEILFSDDDNYVFGMSCAPPGGEIWKDQLMRGLIDPETARMAGALLAVIHNEASRDERTRKWFGEQKVFIEGRIDPYFRTTAKAHPDLAPIFEAEIERVLNTRLTLVHGDYSPKNMFVYADRVFLLDFEVAHYGDPAFDVAFCINHLILKAVRFSERCRQLMNAVLEFWRAYIQRMDLTMNREITITTIRELGCLMLARIDGKSKIEYIREEPQKDLVREMARRTLTGDYYSLEALLPELTEDIFNYQKAYSYGFED